MLPNLMPYFDKDLKDPRRETKNKLHKLGDIVIIVLCAVLRASKTGWAGRNSPKRKKLGFVAFWTCRTALVPLVGIPSHDTLSDVMGRMNPKVFREAFLCWVQATLPSLSGEQLCLDGKTLRGSRSGGKAVQR